MGLMDKFKNLFTDEEIIEEDNDNIETVEIKEVKKEEKNQLPTFMREKLEEEKNKNIKINNFNLEEEPTLKKEKESIKKVKEFEQMEENKNFKFPIEFSNDDFIETRTRSRQTKQQPIDLEKHQLQLEEEKHKIKKTEQKVKVADIYKDKRETQKEEKKKFKATPIISPIYGVLDKNYSPVDVECNVGENFEKRRPSKNVDFDSVRKKAYGNLSKEIKENLMCENCEYLKEVKECKKKEQASNLEDNLVYEAMNNPTKAYDKKYNTEEYNVKEYNYNDNYGYQDITLDEATENYYDYGVEYEKTTSYRTEEMTKPEENYIRLDEPEDDKIGEREEKKLKSIPPVKSSINLLSTLKKSMGDEQSEKKNLELTDDLFNLIDSMYDERND